MIFLDTNVLSETLKPSPHPMVIEWLVAHDAELALPSVTIAELAYSIERVRPEQRALRLSHGLTAWLDRFRDRIFPFNKAAALVYGEIMGSCARLGRPMSVPDGMIAATARINSAALATRNVSDFRETGLVLRNPWMPAGSRED